ncbi:MAG: MBL fold metallo-hydrolase [Clostridia bacterium]|nr:MBL fold metallo-hydrolase [Clostridia bacterium]
MGSKLLSGLIVALLLAVIAFLQGNGVLPDTVNPNADGAVYLHIIDVGQGSSTLIQQGNEGILIDAGESDYGKVVSDYINACGVDTLKYVVASHPHSDHIGGLPAVLRNYDVGEVLMPEIDEANLPATRVYELFLDTVAERGFSASYCEVGDIYRMGDVTMQILGPVTQIKDLNNMSAICKLSVGDTDVMVLGDAETKELKSVYKHGGNFESELLLMGHHGSSTSLYYDFLYEVDPLEAVISCGRDNSYGHPHEETITYLEENDIEYWRTDYSGDIVYRLHSDGFERIEG